MRQDGLAPKGAAGPAEVVRRKRPASARFAPASEAERLLLLCADWLWESDSQHRIAWLSANFAEHAALAPATVIGRMRLTSLRDAETGGAALADDIAAHRAFRGFVHDLVDREGVARPICLTGLPRFDAAGTFLGYRGTGRVVASARKQPVAPVNEVVAQLDVPIFARDNAQRFLFANMRFAEAFETRPDAVVGRRASEIMSPRQALRLENAENAVLLTGLPCAIVMTFRSGPARIVHLARIERAGGYAIAGHLQLVPAPAAVEAARPLDGARVLVVHHDETHRRDLSSRMTGARFDACAVRNAVEALCVLRATAALDRPADCILLDEQMPSEDLADIIRISPQVARTPVVLLAANDQPERVLATVSATISRHRQASAQ